MKKVLPVLSIGLLVAIFSLGILVQSGKLHVPSPNQNFSVTVLSKLDTWFPGSGPVSETEDEARVKIDSWTVVFSKKKDLDTQISALQEIVNNLRIDRSQKVTIDLRFGKAVIRKDE